MVPCQAFVEITRIRPFAAELQVAGGRTGRAGEESSAQKATEPCELGNNALFNCGDLLSSVFFSHSRWLLLSRKFFRNV